MSRFFGPIRQNGYVVRDLDAAVTYWTTVLGIGPFYCAERVRGTEFHYHGVACDPPDIKIALSSSGDLQIELVELQEPGPHMFRDFLDAGHEGLQHLGYWFDTPARMDAALALAAEHNYAVAMSGTFGVDGRFAHLMPEAHPGTVIELSEVCGGKAELFRTIAEAARTWDGSDPIRPLRRPT
jgi:catechol 2,3-dioxygenase-like lactoylglutathione lyase family enzyme